MNEDARQTNNTGTALALATAWGFAGVGTYLGVKGAKAIGGLAYDLGENLFEKGKGAINNANLKKRPTYNTPGGPTIENAKKPPMEIIPKDVQDGRFNNPFTRRRKEENIVNAKKRMKIGEDITPDSVDINNMLGERYGNAYANNADVMAQRNKPTLENANRGMETNLSNFNGPIDPSSNIRNINKEMNGEPLKESIDAVRQISDANTPKIDYQSRNFTKPGPTIENANRVPKSNKVSGPIDTEKAVRNIIEKPSTGEISNREIGNVLMNNKPNPYSSSSPSNIGVFRPERAKNTIKESVGKEVDSLADGIRKISSSTVSDIKPTQFLDDLTSTVRKVIKKR